MRLFSRRAGMRFIALGALVSISVGAAFVLLKATSSPKPVVPSEAEARSRLNAWAEYVRSLPDAAGDPSQEGRSGKTYYVDASNGNDRWDGQTKEQVEDGCGPWQSLPPVMARPHWAASSRRERTSAALCPG